MNLDINFESYLELEKISNGSFYPLKGFMNEENFKSVVNEMRLTNGKLFPIPVLLPITNNLIKQVKKNEILLPEAEKNSDPSWFGFPITIKENSKFKRKDLINHLTKNKIGTRLLFAGNLTKQPAYLNKNFRIESELNTTDLIMNNTFWVGIQPALGEEELSFTAKTIKNFFK